MKLNPDCIRDLMLFCEEHTYIRASAIEKTFVASYHVLHIDSMCRTEALQKYDVGELIYHVIQLSDSGYLATDFHFEPKEFFRNSDLPKIYYVTPKGYEFISSISEKSKWEKTSKVLKSLGSVSLTLIETISKGVTAAAIEQTLVP